MLILPKVTNQNQTFFAILNFKEGRDERTRKKRVLGKFNEQTKTYQKGIQTITQETTVDLYNQQTNAQNKPCTSFQTCELKR